MARTIQAIGGSKGVVYTQSNEPGSPQKGETWYDSDSGIYRAYVDDGSGLQWQPIPPVQVLEESSAFNEDDVFTDHSPRTVMRGYSISLGLNWRVNAKYASVEHTFSSQSSSPQDITWNDDGTKLYSPNLDIFYEYDLSTAYDVSTASYNSVSVSSSDSLATGMTWRSDGTKFISAGTDAVALYEYDLSTAWDLGSASHNGTTLSAQSSGTLQNLISNDDGTKLYEVDRNGTVYEWDLSTAWDLTTASYNGVSLSTQDGTAVDAHWGHNGEVFYECGADNNAFYEYDVGTPYDLSTVSYNGSSASTRDGSPRGMGWKPDGTRVYDCGLDFDGFNEFHLDTPGDWTVKTVTYNGTSISSQASTPYDIEWKADGTKFYEAGSGGTIYEWEVSTPWDLSTASYTGTSASIDDTDPVGMYWRPNGKRLFVAGDGSSNIYQYNLDTAWDITTLSLETTINSQNSSVYDITFKPDGTKLWESSNTGTGDDMYELELGTAWALSTATNNGTQIAVQGQNARGVFWSRDGTRFFSAQAGADELNEYHVPDPWDLSSGSFSGDNVNTQSGNPQGVTPKPDGTKFYEIGGNANIFEYDISFEPVVSSGTSTVGWTAGVPDNINSWDLATFSETEDGGTVTADIVDGNSNTIFSDIEKNMDISTIDSGSDVRFNIILENAGQTNPTLDYVARRFTQ